MLKSRDFKSIISLIYELGILSKTPRSGLWFLGSGKQSVAEHVLRVTLISYLLAHLTPKADKNKTIFLCLVHDLGEGRTSDLNYVHQKYGRLAEAQALEDIASSLSFGKEISGAFREFMEMKTIEAKIAKDADQLEWITTLREQEMQGNTKARLWARIALKRLKTPAAKKLGKLLMKTHPDSWWFHASDKWFVSRHPRLRSWKK